MKRLAHSFVAGLLFLPVLLQWVPDALAQHNLEQAQKEWPDLKLLAPNQVKSLNDMLRADLSKRGCRIPMFTKWDGRHNVISGAFMGSGSKDVAVLCLIDDDMSIIVYPNGGTANAQPVRTFPADAYRMIFSSSPFVMKKKAIRDNTAQQLPAFDHDGIEDGPVGGRSETVYFYDGNWVNVF